ncbi:hypothetical protein HOY82DRAFT_541527 [Tuber indicum]|nr:hypothetical protein HOY82DRAFT_541527 [Tuber indicum]
MGIVTLVDKKSPAHLSTKSQTFSELSMSSEQDTHNLKLSDNYTKEEAATNMNDTELAVNEHEKINTGKKRQWNMHSNESEERNKKKARPDQIKPHSRQVTATTEFGYISLDHYYWMHGSIKDWIDAAVIALRESGRSAKSVSYRPASRQSSKVFDTTRWSPALELQFCTKDQLLKAIGPIIILRYQTKVDQQRSSSKGCVFMIPLGTWYGEEQKMLEAFKVQAVAEVQAWGWRQFRGAKTNLVIQTVLPPGRVVKSIVIDGWRQECMREEQQACCCCKQAHSCFDNNAECKNLEVASQC